MPSIVTVRSLLAATDDLCSSWTQQLFNFGFFMSIFASRSNLVGILSAIGATFFFSINDMTVKLLSGDYALHQIILIRSIIGMIVLMAVIVLIEGGWADAEAIFFVSPLIIMLFSIWFLGDWLGVSLKICGGLFMFWREAVANRAA